MTFRSFRSARRMIAPRNAVGVATSLGPSGIDMTIVAIGTTPKRSSATSSNAGFKTTN